MAFYNKEHIGQEIVSVALLVLFTIACLCANIGNTVSHGNICLFFVGGLALINAVIYFMGKDVKIVPFITLAVLVLIMGTAYSIDESNPDLDGYLRGYTYLQDYGISHLNDVNADTNGGADLGFLILMYLFIILGFSYNGFVTTLAIASAILIVSGIKRIRGNYSFILPCYMLMSFTYDVFQIRFFFAYSIVVYGIHFLIKPHKEPLKYFFSVLIAMAFHFSSVFFLILLVTPKFLSRNYKIIVACFIALFAMAYLNIGSLMTIVASMLPAERLMKYASQGIDISIFTSAFVSIIVLTMIMIAGYIHKVSQNTTTETLLRLNILCSIVIPIVPISLDFERFLRPVLMTDYAVLSSPIIRKKGRRYAYCFLVIVLSSLRVSVMVGGFTRDIVTNNYFMDFLFA